MLSAIVELDFFFIFLQMYTQHYMSSLDDAKHFRRMELNLIKHFLLQFALYLDIDLVPIILECL